MGVQPPFLYDATPKNNTQHPYNNFDPKAVSRASLQPRHSRPKQEGPLVSFNHHPDSYLILPCGKTHAIPMSPSVKTWVKWTRIVQLGLRCLEILGAIGMLVMMILIKGNDPTLEWIMRIVPGVAILHTAYGIYHLQRRASGRTPATSASYMFFAAIVDVSIVPFYALSALVTKTRDAAWTTILTDQAIMSIFCKVMFYLYVVWGGLHLISFVLSLYLAVTFRKIVRLPPDMNPLEDNLTSRHKRNKSSVSVSTTAKNRLSTPLESESKSGAKYKELSRPPSIPFLHTNTQSTESLSTYRSTPPGSRDSRSDLPSRQYQIGGYNSARSSVVELKRSSVNAKRGSYTAISASDAESQRSSTTVGKMAEVWYTADSLPLSGNRSRTASPKKSKYQPLQQNMDSEEITSMSTISTSTSTSKSTFHPNPLESNPPTPPTHQNYHTRVDSPPLPLTEISSNNRSSSSSGDIADMSSHHHHRPVIQVPSMNRSPKRGDGFKAKYYGELKPGTPPIMIGSAGSRQISSGNDFAAGGMFSNEKGNFRRDVSGKIAEEGRGGNYGNENGSGTTRFRNRSGASGIWIL